jgi:hypothetical protein
VQNYFALHTSEIDMQTRAEKMRGDKKFERACVLLANLVCARNPYFIVAF